MVPLFTGEVVGRDPIRMTFRFADPDSPKAGLITFESEVSFVADEQFEALAAVELEPEMLEQLTGMFGERLGELLQRQIFQQAGLGTIRVRRAA